MTGLPFRIILRDRNTSIVEAWREAFDGVDDVEPSVGDIFDCAADAIVSPANSFGYMDGGIDLVYLERFGQGLQQRLQKRLREEFLGELPVGQATMVATLDPELPWMVSSPTMRVPMPVPDTVNAYLAFRAALLVGKEHAAGDPPIRRLLCPGLATAIGCMPARRCARQMRLAYDVVSGLRSWPPARAGEVLASHREMTLDRRRRS